jgi:hypothetical protein
VFDENALPPCATYGISIALYAGSKIEFPNLSI